MDDLRKKVMDAIGLKSIFHTQDGFFFGRMANGSVVVMHNADFTTLDDSSWASAVASVCARGESGETYDEALTLHRKE